MPVVREANINKQKKVVCHECGQKLVMELLKNVWTRAMAGDPRRRRNRPIKFLGTAMPRSDMILPHKISASTATMALQPPLPNSRPCSLLHATCKLFPPRFQQLQNASLCSLVPTSILAGHPANILLYLLCSHLQVHKTLVLVHCSALFAQKRRLLLAKAPILACSSWRT